MIAKLSEYQWELYPKIYIYIYMILQINFFYLNMFQTWMLDFQRPDLSGTTI